MSHFGKLLIVLLMVGCGSPSMYTTRTEVIHNVELPFKSEDFSDILFRKEGDVYYFIPVSYSSDTALLSGAKWSGDAFEEFRILDTIDSYNTDGLDDFIVEDSIVYYSYYDRIVTLNLKNGEKKEVGGEVGHGFNYLHSADKRVVVYKHYPYHPNDDSIWHAWKYLYPDSVSSSTNVLNPDGTEYANLINSLFILIEDQQAIMAHAYKPEFYEIDLESGDTVRNFDIRLNTWSQVDFDSLKTSFGNPRYVKQKIQKIRDSDQKFHRIEKIILLAEKMLLVSILPPNGEKRVRILQVYDLESNTCVSSTSYICTWQDLKLFDNQSFPINLTYSSLTLQHADNELSQVVFNGLLPEDTMTPSEYEDLLNSVYESSDLYYHFRVFRIVHD